MKLTVRLLIFSLGAFSYSITYGEAVNIEIGKLLVDIHIKNMADLSIPQQQLDRQNKSPAKGFLQELQVLLHNHVAPDDNFLMVDDGNFYRSRQLTTEKLEQYINIFKIKTVVNLRKSAARTNEGKAEEALCKRLGVDFNHVPMNAKRMPAKETLYALLDIFDNAPRPIIVHCKAGADRTGLVAALWVLDQMGRSRPEAAQQLATTYGHSPWRLPAMDFFLSIWEGRYWLHEQYNPANYPQFTKLLPLLAESTKKIAHHEESTQPSAIDQK
jgi:protein tyrosine phosphatase (PTP) superfamily phosphohydrolase (DUF442 family)